VCLDEAAIPIRDPVVSVCEILAYDPLLLACEGRVVAVVGVAQAELGAARWRGTPGGEQTARIGGIEEGPARVLLETELGGSRVPQPVVFSAPSASLRFVHQQFLYI